MTATNGLIEEAFQQFIETGEISGLLAAADYLDECGRLPELASELRRLQGPKFRADVRFYAKHAGYSYDPQRESQTEGRLSCAVELANAAQWANDVGVDYEWEYDDESQQENPDDEGEYWYCIATLGNKTASLFGIHFAGHPYHDPYNVVVAAELALELRQQCEQ